MPVRTTRTVRTATTDHPRFVMDTWMPSSLPPDFWYACAVRAPVAHEWQRIREASYSNSFSIADTSDHG